MMVRMALPATLPCPRCGKAMESGVLGPVQGLRWTPSPGPARLRGEYLGYQWPWQNFPGWRCHECKLAVVDYGGPTH